MVMKKIQPESKRLDSGITNLKKHAEDHLKWLNSLNHEESIILRAETAADP